MPAGIYACKDFDKENNIMTKLAIIGGTGLTQLGDLTIINADKLTTPYGSPFR